MREITFNYILIILANNIKLQTYNNNNKIQIDLLSDNIIN